MLKKLLFSTVLFFSLVNFSFAATFTAVTGTGNWNDGATWGNISPGLEGIDFPGIADDATIPRASANIIVNIPLGITANCNNLTMGNGPGFFSGGSFLVVNSSFGPGATTTLNVNGNIAMTGGSASGSQIFCGFSNVVINVIGNINFTSGSSLPSIDISSGGTVNLDGTLSPNGTIVGGSTSGSIFNFKSNNTFQTIQLGANYVYENITVNNTDILGAILSAAITTSNVNGNITIASGVLDNGGFAIVGNALKNLSISSGATFKLTGTTSMPTGFGTTTISNGSIVEFGGTTQNVDALTYSNLAISGAQIKTLAGAIITDDLSITAGALDNGGFSITGNATKTLAVSSGAILKLTGTTSMPTGFTTTTLSTGSTVEFGGTTQNVDANAYYNLTISGSGTKTLQGASSVQGTLAINAGTFNMNAQSFTVKSNASGDGAIGNIIGTLSGATAVTIERYVNQGEGWYMLSCPMATQPMNTKWMDNFVISGPLNSDYPRSSGIFESMYVYDNALSTTINNAYATTTDALTNLNTGTSNQSGYYAWIQNEDIPGTRVFPITIDINGGVLNTGNQVISPKFNAGGNGYNLLGNPYPSSIDWNTTGGKIALTNVSNIAQVLSSIGGTTGNYLAIDAAAGGGTIAMGEGYWVDATAAAPSITITESAKNSDGTSSFSAKAANTNLIASLNLEIAVNGHKDVSYLRFRDIATINRDPLLEGTKLGNVYGRTNIATVINDTDMVVNYLPQELNGSQEIPIRIWAETNTASVQNYALSLTNIADLISKNKCISLEDRALGTTFSITQDTSYAFTMNDSVTVSRFFLHISSPINTIATSADCNTTGKIVATGDGAGPFNYVWTDLFSGDTIKTTMNTTASDSISNLLAGTYSVEVSNNTCGGTLVSNVEIDNPTLISTNYTTTNNSCATSNDAAINLTATGATGTLTYRWSNGELTESLTGIAAGNYSVTITDANGCETVEANISVTSPSPIVVTESTTDNSCANTSSDGVISLTSTGGTGAITYLWDNNQTTATISSLNAGNYTVTATDANNCSTTSNFTLLNNDNVTAMATAPDSTTINQAVIFDNTSTGANTYLWDFGDGTTSSNELPAHTYTSTGTYTVTLTAMSNSCTNSTVITVNIIAANATSIQQINNNSMVSIYSNNSDGITLDFKLNKREMVYISVINMLGQNISYSKATNVFNEKINLNLPTTSGLYLVKVVTKNKTFVKKINR